MSTKTQPDPAAPTMQQVLLTLQRFWTDRGAMVVQPFNTEVGAGTGNPATALRVLGPEPWTVGYVEPSVRPDDARYGENPNRLQTHTQFQVILKPDPGNPQEIYLESLQALGIDLDAHDIRFVEDNWASPALGAWGLGWEVWLDGLEITQFTYFQQAGGLTLDPVSVELTYGIERIVMALQKVDHFKNIAYAQGISYGEVFGQSEYEMSRYYLDDADISTNQRLLGEYAAEAERMLDARLPVPAYVYVLKCSHTFNVLDARGAISTTERAKAFNRMRALTRRCAQLWTERRAELGHPLGVVNPPPAAQLPADLPEVNAPATLLVEIGLEELPWHQVQRGAQAAAADLTARLAATRLAYGAVTAEATPRRIVLTVADLAPREDDAEHFAKGPRVSAAYDANGEPTKAALGFARGQKVDPAALQRRTIDGVEHIGVSSVVAGRSAAQLLAEVISEVVGGLRADKNMRWCDAGLSYARPVRWLLVLLGDTPLPVVVSSISSGTTTRVHRTAAEPIVSVAHADGYARFLAAHGITLRTADRRAAALAQAAELAASVGGVIDDVAESALLDQIAAIVEQPHAILGSFDPRYLDLPDAILTTVMRKHQRYLPVRAPGGALLPHFVAVANGDCDADVVRAGYESVLRARYEDAAYFWRADLAKTPQEHAAGLVKLTFADGLGSMADRAVRIAAIAQVLADRAGLADPEIQTVRAAGGLAKFDLASHMVIELSNLAGTMAREYAARAGLPAAVAQALGEMEMPRSAGGELPESSAGAVLSLADRFDLLAGLFATGAKASGSSDPFGLRRASLGIVSVLRVRPELAAISINDGLQVAAAQLRDAGVELDTAAQAEAAEFVIRRYEQALVDVGTDHQLVHAVLPLAQRPAAADAALAELQQLMGDQDFAALVAAVQRCQRIVGQASADADTGVLAEPVELALAAAIAQTQAVYQATSGGVRALADAAASAQLPTAIDAFFDAVLVMADDAAVRAARLALLAKVRDMAAGVADFSAL